MNESSRYAAQYEDIALPSFEDIVNVNTSRGVTIQNGFYEGVTHGVRETLQEGSKTWVIRPMPQTDEVGRIQVRDDQGAYRGVSGANILGLDFPGMGKESDPANDSLEKSLIEGSLTELGSLYWEVFAQSLQDRDQSFDDVDRVVLWGDSLGGVQVAGMLARIPDGIDVTDVVFRSTPFDRTKSEMKHGFRKAAAGRKYYWNLDALNTDETYADRESDVAWAWRIGHSLKRIKANKLALDVLVNSDITETLSVPAGEKNKNRSIRIHGYWSEHDLVAPPSDSEAALTHMENELGFLAVTGHFMNDEYHSFLQLRKAAGEQMRLTLAA